MHRFGKGLRARDSCGWIGRRRYTLKSESHGPPARAVAVGIADGDPRSTRISAIASRLGARTVEGAPHSGRTSIGDVLLPDECDDWFIEAAFVRALEPRHLLFLCVANSARSQMAEGIARSLAATAGPPARSWAGRGPAQREPVPMRISSAGSEPSSVRPQAMEVLAEIGIDISDQRSTGFDDVEGSVDVVVTLCAEEVCPVWLEESVRVHWGLPDPAGAGNSEEEHLQAFREVRDELRRRLAILFTGRAL